MNLFNIFRKSSDAGTSEQVCQKPSPSSPVTPQPPVATTSDNGQEARPQTKEQDCNTSSMESGSSKSVYNLLILDESGSMMAIYKSALTGMNETLQTIRMAQKEHPEQRHYVSLIAFDSNHYNQIYDCIGADKALDIKKSQYRPEGATPLFDAMGRSITELRSRLKEGDVVLVTIITDGFENASHEYNGKAIKNLVESLKTQGWVFTYIGANQDVHDVARRMSIDNFLSFDADDESTRAMFKTESQSRKRFFNKLRNDCSFDELSKGYFDKDDEK